MEAVTLSNYLVYIRSSIYGKKADFKINSPLVKIISIITNIDPD